MRKNLARVTEAELKLFAGTVNGKPYQEELLRRREAGVLPWPCFSCNGTGRVRISTVQNKLRKVKTPCARCIGKGHYYEKRSAA